MLLVATQTVLDMIYAALVTYLNGDNPQTLAPVIEPFTPGGFTDGATLSKSAWTGDGDRPATAAPYTRILRDGETGEWKLWLNWAANVQTVYPGAAVDPPDTVYGFVIQTNGGNTLASSLVDSPVTISAQNQSAGSLPNPCLTFTDTWFS